MKIDIRCTGTENISLDAFTELQGNLKELSNENYEKLKASLIKYGFCFPVFCWKDGKTFFTMDAHQRVKTLTKLRSEGYTIPDLPTVYIEAKDKIEAKELLFQLNSNYGKMTQDGVYEFLNEPGFELLPEILNDVDLPEFDVDAFNQSFISDDEPPVTKNLNDKFLVPPFSILDTRQGYWQQHKEWWKEKIKDRGETRNDTLITSIQMKYKPLYQKYYKSPTDKKKYSFPEYLELSKNRKEKEQLGKSVVSAGVSILDAVLAELSVRWFGVPGGDVFDCFAGDSVFGYVCAFCGYNFTGIELREEQATKNQERLIAAGLKGKYICDDGQNVGDHIKPDSQDFLFSCPPYYDLEVYSDLQEDASNQETFEDFYKILETAFTASIKCLKNNRFAVIVCGDVRGKEDGTYYLFPDRIKETFINNGMSVYNELILIENPVTAGIRANASMKRRKVVKTHQNILVFYKGDTKEIKNIFPELEIIYESADLE